MKPKPVPGPLLLALALFVSGSLCPAAEARGPLRIHPDNPRYFTDGTKTSDDSFRSVYLTGSHTWNNLVDMGRNDPPEKFDWNAYLASLEQHHHNFVRLWAWDSTRWDTRGNEDLGTDFIHIVAPLPWARKGEGNALDGKPKFDLTKFDADYFERLRSRVQSALDRGIYVSVMLFEGWGLFHGNRRKQTEDGWAWRNHPFNPANNVNNLTVEGSDALSGRVHNLRNPEINKLQAAYVRKVIDTVNEFDNVLYEVINEGGDQEWNWWVIRLVHDYERTKPKQHPVGNTGHGVERVKSLLASPADWVSPGSADGFGEDAPVWNEKKVSIFDTDHVWGVGGNPMWVWKSFVRGHNPIFMDPYDGSVLRTDSKWESMRNALGYVRRLAERVNLARLTPHEDISSTKYCLADPSREYVVVQPEKNAAFSVDLKAGAYELEWIDPFNGSVAAKEKFKSENGRQTFKAPFESESVLHLLNVSN
jgi:hypothetical protein